MSGNGSMLAKQGDLRFTFGKCSNGAGINANEHIETPLCLVELFAHGNCRRTSGIVGKQTTETSQRLLWTSERFGPELGGPKAITGTIFNGGRSFR